MYKIVGLVGKTILLFFNRYFHEACILSFHFNTVMIMFDVVFGSYCFRLCHSLM